MKTKKQLLQVAMKGPDPKYNTLLQILDVLTDQRNITIACILEEDGENIEAVKVEMKRIYQKEVGDEEDKETKAR